MAVVDWSLWNPENSVLAEQKSKIHSSVECELEPSLRWRLHDGEVVYIASFETRCVYISGKAFNLCHARVWSPRHRRFILIISHALHPIVSEEDVIEIEMKHGLSLGIALDKSNAV